MGTGTTPEERDRLAAIGSARCARFLLDLERLVGIDSGTRDVAGVEAVAGWMMERLQELGASVHSHHDPTMGSTHVATFDGAADGPSVLLLGHAEAQEGLPAFVRLGPSTVASPSDRRSEHMTRSRTTQARGSRVPHSIGWAALALSLPLVLAACGGGDDDSTATAADPSPATTAAAAGAVDSGAETAATEAASETGASEAPADSGSEDGVPQAIKDLASETGSAVVTIGDTTWEFSLAGTNTVDGTTHVGICKSLFGMIAGNGYATDGSDITMDMEIPPTDWATYEDERFGPPSIGVEDNVGNASWLADEGNEFVTGGGVGEYEQDGTSASGSATFVNQWAPDSDPVEGTFEIDCEA